MFLTEMLVKVEAMKVHNNIQVMRSDKK